MGINSSNIRSFIQYLYQNRLQQAATEEILDSWTGLSDEEVRLHLQQLFDSWQYTEAQKLQEIDGFLRQQAPPTSPVAPIETPQTQTINPGPEPQNNYQTVQEKKRGNLQWLLWLLVPILLAGGYVLYKFQQFQNMKYVYVTTDNVAIRDYQGNSIGRMDIYPKNNSVSYARAADNDQYEITINDKKYAYRRILTDSTTFRDFLFNNEKAFGFVNENYLIDDKNDFILYRDVFKEINNVPNENADLTSAFRKVIIGSIKQTPQLKGLFIVNTCSNTKKEFSSIIKHKLADDEYGVVTQLSDGNYYIFYGNPKNNTFATPTFLQLEDALSNSFTDIKNYDYLFKMTNGYFYVFNCDGTATDYYAVFDGKGKIAYLKPSNTQNDYQ